MKLFNRNYGYYDHKRINNLKELLDLKLEENKNEIAFSFREDNLIVKKTFNDVYKDVENLSNYFYNKYKNKHISLISENSYTFIVTFLSIIMSGNVCVVIDKDLDKKDMLNLIKTSDTKVVYYSNKYCPFIKDFKIKSEILEDIEYYIEQGKQLKNKYKIDDDKDAVIFFTSGTTGPNKGVVLSNKNIAFDIYAASSLFKLSGSVVSVLPYHHAFGLITSVLKPFYYGKEVFINSSLKNIMKDFKTINPETLFVVPVFIETFYKQIWKNARKSKKEKILKHTLRISNSLQKLRIDLRSILLPIPSLDEKSEIVDYLDEKTDAIDFLIQKKEQLITELEDYKKSLIYEYVTGKKEVI